MENCTQVLDESFIDNFHTSDIGRVKVGSLSINGVAHDIYRGDNVIGRDELSDIVIRSGAISSKHAVIEVEDWDTELLYDCGSTNKTRLGKVILKPNVRYNLLGNDDIMFADLKAKYTKLDRPQPAQTDDDDGSGSETGSESMLICESVNLAAHSDDDDDERKQLLAPSTVQNESIQSENKSADISDTLMGMNDSSISEEKKNDGVTGSRQIVDETVDESTDDEDDFFVLPSQTVKEFNSSKQESSNFKPSKKPTQILTQDLFDPDEVAKHVADRNSAKNTSAGNNTNDIFEMETQEQDFDVALKPKKTSLEKQEIDGDSQALFNTEAQILTKVPTIPNSESIFEAETQDVVCNPMTAQKETSERKQIRGYSSDFFDAETELPDFESPDKRQETDDDGTSRKRLNKSECEITESNKDDDLKQDDLEMSDLALSSGLTQINTSLQSVENPNISTKNLAEELTQPNISLKEKADNKESNGCGTTLSDDNETKKVENKGKTKSATEQSNTTASTQLNSNSLFLSSSENKEDLEKVTPEIIKDKTIGPAKQLNQINDDLFQYKHEDLNESMSNALTQKNIAHKAKQQSTIKKTIRLTNQNNSEYKETSNDNCSVDHFDTALTQKNDLFRTESLNKTPKSKDLNFTDDFPCFSSDDLTQVNPALETNSNKKFHHSRTGKNKIVESSIADEENIDYDEDYIKKIAAEETQLNLNICEREKGTFRLKKAQVISNNTEGGIKNIEAEETQPNLNLDFLFHEEGTGEDISKEKVDFYEAETQPYYHFGKSATCEMNDKIDVQIDTGTGLGEKCAISEKEASLKENRQTIKPDTIENDESSRESDSLLASVPLDIDDIEAIELQQSSINTKIDSANEPINKDEIVCNIIEAKSNIALKQNLNKCNESIKQDDQEEAISKSTLTVADMEVCSTVGDNINLSTLTVCESIKKSQSNSGSELKRTPQAAKRTCVSRSLKRSCKNLDEPMSPIVEEEISKSVKTRRSRNLFGGHPDKASGSMLNQSVFLNEPCSSSTPFKTEDGNKIECADVMPLKEATLKTPTKKTTVEVVEESPVLPSTEELLVVADKTPEGKHMSPSGSAKRRRNMLPLALQRTPRVKKLSKKMSEHLSLSDKNSEKGIEAGFEAKSSDLNSLERMDSYYSSSNMTEVKELVERKESPVKANSKDKVRENIETDKPIKSSRTSKRKAESIKPKQDVSCERDNSDELKVVKDQTNEVILKDIKDLKLLSISIKDINVSLSLRKKSDNDIPIKKAKKSPLKLKHDPEDSSLVEKPLDDNQQLNIKHKSTRSKKLPVEVEKINEAVNNKTVITQESSQSNRKNRSKNKGLLPLLGHESKKESSQEIPASTTCNLSTSKTEITLKKCSIVLDSSVTDSSNNTLSSHKTETIAVNTMESKQSPLKRTKRNQKEDAQEENQQGTKHRTRPNRSDKELESPKQEVIETRRHKRKTDNRQKDITEIKIDFSNEIESPLNKRNFNSANSDKTGISTSGCKTELEFHSPSKKSRKVPQSTGHSELMQENNTGTCLKNMEDQSENSNNKVSPVKNKRTIKLMKDGENERKKNDQNTSNESDTDSSNLRKSKRGQKACKRETSPQLEQRCVGKNKTLLSASDKNLQNLEVVNSLPETHSRRSGRSHKGQLKADVFKEDITTQITKTDSLDELKLKPDAKNKRKLKDDLRENSITPNLKLSNCKKNKSNDQHSDNESSNKFSDKNEELSDSDFGSGGSKRARVKPSRFREDNSDSSTNERGSLTSRRQKNSSVSDSLEFIDSTVSEEGNKKKSNSEKTTFAVPTKVNSRKKVKENESMSVSESKERRSRSRTKDTVNNADTSSRSRSGSLSSQISMENEHSVVQSPRRSIKKGEQVLFTGLSNSTFESNIKKLGGAVVECANSCSVLVTDKVRRTVKFLCVLGQGKPIVPPDWIVRSWRCCNFEDPMNHLLVDSDAEQRFNFRLHQTIQEAKRQPLLNSYSIYTTPSVKPPPQEIKSIVECCGGVFLAKVPSVWPDKAVVISHTDDKALWKKLKVKGTTPPIVAAEMLLLGVLQHKVDLKSHKLS